MADAALAAGLNAVPLVANHYHKVVNPVRDQYKKMKGDMPRNDPDIRDTRTWEEKGYELRKRSEVRPDEEIVETVRHRGEIKPRRPSNYRRSSSANGARGYGGGYESEGSVPPRSRVRAKSQSGRSRGRRSSSSSSTSSSDLGSSTDEEKQCRKMQQKKWITAALASVATIHAASKVYSSIEAHDKRILDVERGKISPEEAQKKQKRARWQDAAAIGIAALGIKGALSEWNEVHEEHEHHKELMEKHEELHKKRMERMRRQKARENNGYYKGRDGTWYYDGPEMQDSQRSRSRSYSAAQLDGPRNGERKLIEPARSRGRSVIYDDHKDDYDYDRDDRSRRRSSRYNDDDRF